jgi:uncharacterized membrane protein YfcA
LEVIHIPLLILLGFGSGFLNTVGGGGTLLTVPVLTFLGVPITIANATARVAILAQNITASGGFRSKRIELPLRYSLYLCLVSMAGGIMGSLLASVIDDYMFSRIFVLIMLVSVVLIVVNPRSATETEENMSTGRQVIGIISFFFVGIYGGFIQAGIGFLVIGVLRLVNNFNLVKINFIKVFVAIVYTAVSVFIFAWQGKILWQMGLVLAVGQGIGGWYASRWSVDKGEVWIKRVMIATIVALAVKLWFF